MTSVAIPLSSKPRFEIYASVKVYDIPILKWLYDRFIQSKKKS